MVEVAFKPAGSLSAGEVAARRDAATVQQLGSLLNSPEFAAWQQSKARRELRAKAVSNVLLAAACVALLVALAMLRPTPAPPTAMLRVGTDGLLCLTMTFVLEQLSKSPCPVSITGRDCCAY